MKMTEKDWDLIFRVHVKGAFSVTRAAWNYMRDQGYGRIIMTSSAAGLYGNFGQANYSAAKLALVGFANTLSKEGEKRNIYCNTIAPVAASRMTESILPPDVFKALKPEYVAPLVAFLCSEQSKVNGGIFEVGAGWVSQVRWQRSSGVVVDQGKIPQPESFMENWAKAADFSNAQYPISASESISHVIPLLSKL